MTTRTQMKDLMKRLHGVYEETGGTRLLVKEEMDYRQSVNGFDALLVLAAKKLQLIRERINLRDEQVEKSRKKSSKRNRSEAERHIIQLNNDLRKMLSFVRADLRKLNDLYRKGMKKGKWSRKNADPEILTKQIENLHLLESHVKEVEALSRRRVDDIDPSLAGGDTEDNDQRALLFSGPLGGAEDDSSNKENPLSSMLIREDELPMDSRDSNLPQLDIQEQMHKVKDYKKQIDEGLDTFAAKLEKLQEMSKDISHELDDQSLILNDIDKKVDLETEKLEQLNKRTRKANAETANSMRWLFLAAFLVVIAILILIGGVYVMVSFRPLEF